MKKLLLNMFLLVMVQITHGQVETRFFPQGNAFDKIQYIKNNSKAQKLQKLPSFNIEEMLEDDKMNEGKDIPFRFGKGFDMNISLSDGNWTEVKDGRLWSMEFESKGAFSINFVFNDFYLPEGAELYIANREETMIYGPVTSKQNTKNGFFLTDLVQGNNVAIYLFEPTNKEGQVRLTIKRVVHAYKNMFIHKAYGNLGASGSCNNNIACFPTWDLESDAIALVLLSNGTEWCSGSLLMTTDQSFRPYFLSAFHCVDYPQQDGVLSTGEIANAENWLFKFQYKMTTCTGSTATTGITYNGADFRAAWNNTDFVLMEMTDSPVNDERFSWLGWDRSGNTPTSGTSVHHPSGDVMKISFDNNQLLETNYGSNTGNSHWRVIWDNGITEGGSSGSPLFDQNKRIIGQLHGGYAACNSSDLRDWYGCFYRSWTGGGTNATRLSNWLDPTNTGVMMMNTSRYPTISGPSTICNQATFMINNLPQGATVQWSASNTKLSLVTQSADSAVFQSDYYGNSTIYATITIGNSNFTVSRSVLADIDLTPLNNCYISASDFTCGTASFTMLNLPASSVVRWSCDAGIGYSTDVDPTYSFFTYTYPVSHPGVDKIKAQITHKGKTQDWEHEFDFNFNRPYVYYQVGDTILPDYGFYSNNGLAAIDIQYNYPFNWMNSDWSDWSVYGGGWDFVDGSNEFATFEGPTGVPDITIELCFDTPCGGRTCYQREFAVPQSLYGIPASAFSLSPNPASDYVTISLAENATREQKSKTTMVTATSSDDSYEIQLWNSFGLVKQVTTDQPNYQLSLSGIPKGLYYVHVIKNKTTYRKQLIVE